MTSLLPPANIVAGNIYNNVNLLLNYSINMYQQIYNQVWNPVGCTTADVLTVYGSNAATLLAKLAGLASNIVANGGTLPNVSGAKSYTANQDGTVTLI